MGTIKHGILGGFRKKTGTVIGAYWRSLDVIRSLPRSSNKKPTQAQQDQQLKFALVTKYLSRLSGLINVGFNEPGSIATAMNRAVVYHLNAAVTGASPNFSIDPAKVMFSQGNLEEPDEVVATPVAGQKVDIAWTNIGEDEELKDDTDTLTVLAYHPVKAKFYKMVTTVERAELSYSLQLPTHFAGVNADLYIGFRSVKTRNLVSNSMYLGSLAIL